MSRRNFQRRIIFFLEKEIVHIENSIFHELRAIVVLYTSFMNFLSLQSLGWKQRERSNIMSSIIDLLILDIMFERK